MLRIAPLMALVACTPEEHSAEAPPSGECSSTTRAPWSNAYLDIFTAYDAQGREVYRREEYFQGDGEWLGTKELEHGYVDGRLVSLDTTWEVSETSMAAAVDERTLYAYDAEGRLVEEQRDADGEPWSTTSYRYDAEGQLIETYLADLSGINDDWQQLRTWEDGRLRRYESWNVDENGLAAFEDYAYLEPAPSLDAHVLIFDFGTELEVLRSYDGELLVEAINLTGPDLRGYDTYQWVHRGDGQVEVERSIGPERRDVVLFRYDTEGRVVQRVSGEDPDGDDVIDVVFREQTWAWTCD